MSLYLGLPIAEIDNMLYCDFMRYMAYKRRRLMPFERLEVMIAQLNATLVAVNSDGKKRINIKDYLIKDNLQNRQPENKIDFDILDLSKIPVKSGFNFDLFRNRRIKRNGVKK